MAVDAPRPRGIRASVKRVVGHGGSLLRLERELARLELRRKTAALGLGVALLVGAALVGFFALAFGLATAAAALALVVDTWLALLIVFAVLLLVTLALALVGVGKVRKGAPPVPEQALEEARLTSAVLKSRGG